MNQEVFVELIKYLWAITGRKDPPGDVLILGWYVALRDVSESQLVAAIDRYVRERASEYPTPQLLRELSGVQITRETEGVSAWDEVLRAIKHYGGYQTPQFSDRRIAAAIKHLGGWVRLCDTETEELHKWTRQSFLKTFAAMPGTVEDARLTNLIEAENAKTGQTEAAAQIQRRIESGHRQERIERQLVARLRDLQAGKNING